MKKNPEPWDQLPESSNCVTIFGAGIAGLTAAHELIERGFRVQIWEPAGDQREPQRGCDIGGMARTQWSRVHRPDEGTPCGFDAGSPQPLRPSASQVTRHGVPTQPILHFPQKIEVNRKHLDHLSVRDPRSPYESVSSYTLPDDVRAWSWSGVQLSVRNWEILSFEERLDIAGTATKAIASALCLSASVPYFDRGVQLWKADLHAEADSKTKRPLIFNGQFPAQLSHNMRIAADVFGVLNFWEDKQNEDITSARFHDAGTLVLYQQWEPGTIRALGTCGSQDLKVLLAEIVDGLAGNREIRHLYLEISDPDFAALTDDERTSRARILAEILKPYFPPGVRLCASRPGIDVSQKGRTCQLTATLTIDGPPKHEITLEVVPSPVLGKTVPNASVLIGFRVREHRLPGEHGYRFFPSFYRHVFDTMKRIPILELVGKSEFSGERGDATDASAAEQVRYVGLPRTAFDNIHPTASHVLAFANGQRPVALSRSVPVSFTEVGQYIKVLFGVIENGGFAINPRESVRYSLKLFKYMTSCGARRVEYEKESWWDFVDGDSYSKGIQDLLRKWPEALVAMNAKTADARSHGNAVVQLILDNIRPRGYRDGTLRGPTSEAWFKYWRRYLETRGVEFVHGRLTGFKVTTDRILPKVECYQPGFPRNEPSVENELGDPVLMRGYFVMAIAADQAVELSQALVEDENYQSLSRPPCERSAFAHVAEIRANGLDQAEPRGDFRHFAGIQFYFAEDVLWVDGHVYYPDSPWGLTSISQARFWQDFAEWEHGFRGVISAIVATWNKPGKHTTTKTAWECTKEEFAREVWAQIKSSVEGNADGREVGGSRYVVGSRKRSGAVPDPLYWHIDDFLKYCETKERFENSAPFHIASPAGWPSRPGNPDRGYDVEHGWIVCGMLAKTYTRIPTMEAANESARHAVNAILEQLQRCQANERPRYHGTPCDIFDPEDHEVEDFKWFKDLDEKLIKRGLPHIVDILGLDRLTDTLLRGGESDPLDPVNLTRQLSRIVANPPDFLRRR